MRPAIIGQAVAKAKKICKRQCFFCFPPFQRKAKRYNPPPLCVSAVNGFVKSPSAIRHAVRQAVRQAQGPEQHRRTHGPEQRRGTHGPEPFGPELTAEGQSQRAALYFIWSFLLCRLNDARMAIFQCGKYPGFIAIPAYESKRCIPWFIHG